MLRTVLAFQPRDDGDHRGMTHVDTTTVHPPAAIARLRDLPAGLGAYSAVMSIVCLAAVGAVGVALKQPWVFPSLGPTVMVLAETPNQPAAHPRNVLSGHVVGLGAGYLSLLLLGLTDNPAVTQEGLTWVRVAAAVLSVALTALVLQAIGTPHPPAGATTLIVSLGILKTPASLRAMLLSVILLTVLATLINRAMRVPQEGVSADTSG
jgi:CBS-domain-containing membrane protein